MSVRARLIATASDELEAEALERLGRRTDCLEVRADLLGDVDVDWLRSHYPGQLLYTLRSEAEGGGSADPPARRRERLSKAATRYDFVDLEADRDLRPGVLAAVPAAKRIVSWHGRAPRLELLRERLAKMTGTEARFYKLVPTAAQSGEELVPLALLRSLRRDDVIAFAGGPMGVWTRLVAPRLGAPWVYGAATERRGAPGQPTIETLRGDFGLPELPPVDQVCGIVGNPVSHSLSPRLHNGAYRALGLPYLYLPFEVPAFGDFWLEVVERGSFAELGVPLRGLSITAPFKQVALVVAGASSPLALRLDSANTLISNEGVWEAESTDPEGVSGSLAEAEVQLQGRRALVVGCGGAGRAAAAGLALAGAEVVLTNRSEGRGREAATALGLPFVAQADLDLSRYELAVNATTLGRHPDDPLPFAPDRLPSDAVVLDLVYMGEPTPLVRRARAVGRLAVDGRAVLLHQALGQFRMMTGRNLPMDTAHELLGLEPTA